MTAEAAALRACLRAQREHVLGILEGLPEHDLRRPVLPSGWSCLGLVRHLALDVERFWFRAVVAGEDVELEHGDAAWTVAPDVPARAVLDLYRRHPWLLAVDLPGRTLGPHALDHFDRCLAILAPVPASTANATKSGRSLRNQPASSPPPRPMTSRTAWMPTSCRAM